MRRIPEQNVVEIAEETFKFLRFQISTSRFAVISITYGINGTRTNFHPRPTLDHTATYSAIVNPCNVTTIDVCQELWIMVQGKAEIHNTSFHLVLMEEVAPRDIRRINVMEYFIVLVPGTQYYCKLLWYLTMIQSKLQI